METFKFQSLISGLNLKMNFIYDKNYLSFLISRILACSFTEID